MIAAVIERLQRRRHTAGPPARAAARHRVAMPRALRGRRPSLPVLAILVVVLIALGGAWLWVRDSSLVSVRRVSVTGVSGPDSSRIRSALIRAARNMTTLHVRMAQLHSAVRPFPVVKNLRVDTQFPHGLRIVVVEQVPVAAVTVDGRPIAVAADGTLLHDVPPAPNLAAVPLRVPPGGSRVTEGDALGAVRLLAAAPEAFQTRVSKVSTVPPHGLVAELRNGPSVYFGDSGRLAAKWAAASAVLADGSSAGAVYIDVTDPQRPAAAGVAGAASAPGASSGSGQSADAGSGSVSGAGTSSNSGTTSDGSTSSGGGGTSTSGG
jgi:cell division protein FtsQ